MLKKYKKFKVACIQMNSQANIYDNILFAKNKIILLGGPMGPERSYGAPWGGPHGTRELVWRSMGGPHGAPTVVKVENFFPGKGPLGEPPGGAHGPLWIENDRTWPL